jgi:hypothetical protein
VRLAVGAIGSWRVRRVWVAGSAGRSAGSARDGCEIHHDVVERRGLADVARPMREVQGIARRVRTRVRIPTR